MTSTSDRDAVTNQLQKSADLIDEDYLLMTSNGAPVESLTASMSVGPKGDLVLKDFVLLDHLAAFDHERIPSRVVHAKGAGAHGYFEVTNAEFSKFCKAALFSEVGKQTPIFARFSTVRGEPGSADTVRDPRGFAIKFYTSEGNWDLVANNTPIFFIRDPILFPSFVHSQKRNPTTNCLDYDAFWDFLTLRPESVHQTTFLFSDRGIPDGFRHMDGFGAHTFTVVNLSDERYYVKFHLKTNQGIQNLSTEEGEKIAGMDPDYAVRDLFNAIATDHFPSWTFYVQIMTVEQADQVSFDPFDITKTWPHNDFPLIQVGKLTFNRNPTNYFAEVEQAAFSPANMVPGIEASPDKMLQGRLFSYHDTQRHRLGSNFQQIPINRPLQHVANYQRDGFMNILGNQEEFPDYYPNSFHGPESLPFSVHYSPPVQVPATVEVKRYESEENDNYSQCRVFYQKVLDDAARDRLVMNIASHLIHAQEFIQQRAISNFTKVDKDYGEQLQMKLDALRPQFS